MIDIADYDENTSLPEKFNNNYDEQFVEPDELLRQELEQRKGEMAVAIALYSLDPTDFEESDREAWHWAEREVLGIQQGSIDEVLGTANSAPPVCTYYNFFDDEDCGLEIEEAYPTTVEFESDVSDVEPTVTELLSVTVADGLALDDKGVVLCKGCHSRRTWKNAVYCCAICHRSYGTHHGYYCTQEAEANVDTNAHRAVD
eukprot:14873998-Heterocapsa_arctica.AAC.1